MVYNSRYDGRKSSNTNDETRASCAYSTQTYRAPHIHRSLYIIRKEAAMISVVVVAGST